MQISVPEWDFHYSARSSARILKPSLPDSQIDLHLALDKSVVLVLSLVRETAQRGNAFTIKDVKIEIKRKGESPRANFFAETFLAIFPLASLLKLKLPEIGLDLSINFDWELSSVSQALQWRQSAYQLMVIEAATGVRLSMPRNITGAEQERIALTYHAITQGAFAWPYTHVIVSPPQDWPATLIEQVAGFIKNNTFVLGPDPEYMEIFGVRFYLGQKILTVKNSFIENYSAVQEAMEHRNTQPVPIIVRSATGEAQYEFLGTPQLPAAPWDRKTQQLVDLDRKLGEALADRYIALATATLDGLSDEEKIAVTVRPELDVEAFM